MKNNKIFLILFIGIFLISFASAKGIGTICIDVDKPTWPENSTLILTSSGMNIQLSWTNATDVPDCSGIDYYEIYKGFNGGVLSPIANTSDNSYSDNVQNYGTYEYMIHAFDKVGHNEGNISILNSITISKSSNGGGGRGSSGANLISFWKCEEEWNVCSDEGIQTRICEDLRGYEDNKTETRGCIPGFTPEQKQGNETLNTNPQNLFGTMTGAVIGTLGKGGSLLAAIFAFLIIAGLIAMAVNKKKKIE